MDSSICIVLMIVLILCFALLLAWLAAKSDPLCCVRLTVTPNPAANTSEVRIETPNGALELTLSGCTVSQRVVTPAAPEDIVNPE